VGRLGGGSEAFVGLQGWPRKGSVIAVYHVAISGEAFILSLYPVDFGS